MLRRLGATAMIVAALAALAALVTRAEAGAQVVELQGGASSFYNGYGLAANVWNGDYDGWLGAGYQGGLRVGGFVRLAQPHDTVRAGDDVLSFLLPTDIFGGAYEVLVQGASWQAERRRVRWSLFGGVSAGGLAAPGFAARNAEQPFGAASADVVVAPRLTLSELVAVGHRQTLMSSIKWDDHRGTTTAVDAGEGAGRPYAAVGFSADRPHWSLRASYIHSADEFRLAAVPGPAQTHLDGLNAELDLHIGDRLLLSATQHTFVRDSAAMDVSRARGSSVSATLDGAAGYASVGVYLSHASAGDGLSDYFTVGHAFSDRFATDLYLLRYRFNLGAPTTTPVASFRERLLQRLSLQEMISGLPKRGLTGGVGGELVTPLGTFGAGYQIVYSPFQVAHPFIRTLDLSLKVATGDYSANVATATDAAGRTTLDVDAARYLYLGGESDVATMPIRGRIERFVVRGVVRDDVGRAVAGAALTIGGQSVYTDSNGRFFVRVSSDHPVDLVVSLDAFVTAGQFSVVRAPDQVVPMPEDRAADIDVVVHRQ
jgi:hypothetical protein